MPKCSAPLAVCAMLYASPAVRLAAWASSRLKPRSTLLSGSHNARCICTKALASFGLRCIVSTLFGTKPSVLKKESNSSFSSGVCSGGSGSRRATDRRSHHVLQQQQQPADDADVREKAVLHARALHRVFHFPEAQEQQRCEYRKGDEAEHADGRM